MSRKRRRRSAAVGTVGVVAAGVLVAVALPGGAGAQRAGPTVAPITRTICRDAGPPPTRLVNTAPPAAVLRAFSVLRRGPTPADTPAADLLGPRSPLLATIYRRFVRRLGTGPQGTPDFLVVGRSRLALFGRGCTARERRIDAAARRRFRPQTLVCLTMECNTLAAIRRGGALASSDFGGPATVEGLVPDGVARLVAVYRDRPASTVPVRHNVVRFVVDHSAPNAFPERVLFQDRRGRVVGDFPQPRSGRPDRYRQGACTPE